MSKIGIIGYGYWGQILCNNLMLMGHNDITICDPYIKETRIIGTSFPITPNTKDLYPCDKIFIATPADKHYQICQDFLVKGYDVFCEKPLCPTLEEVHKLYDIIDNGNGNLFVDWTFLYNDATLKLKEEIAREGPPNLIYMNRLNRGPIRTDVSAKHDLAAHDLSILLYLLSGDKLNHVEWKEYKLLPGSQYDSCTGIINFEHTKVIINASWAFNKKIRTCYFNYDNSVTIWDDTSKTIICDGHINHSINSPLGDAITDFLDQDYDKDLNRKITTEVAEMLEW